MPNTQPTNSNNQVALLQEEKSTQVAMIQSIRPKFLNEKNDETNISLLNMDNECLEVTWLRAIQSLDGSVIGVNDPIAFAKFKSLMIILAHENYYNLHIWNLKYQKLMQEIIAEKMKSAVYDIMKLCISGNTLDQKKIATLLFSGLFSVAEISEKLFTKSDQVISKESLEKIIELIAESENNILNNTDNIKEKCSEIVGEGYIDKLIVNGSDRFNIINAEKITELCNVDINTLCKNSKLEKYSKQFKKIHKDYLAYNQSFWALFKDCSINIQKYIPSFNEEMFSKCFTLSFAILNNNKSIYPINYAYEMYLQQYRKIELQDKIYLRLTETYIPLLNGFLKNLDNAQSISMDSLAELADQDRKKPASLHEIVNEAYSILHANPALLTQAHNHLDAWSSNLSVKPTIKDKNEENSLAIIPRAELSHTIVALTDKPLFKSDNAIPGKLSSIHDNLILKVSDAHKKYALLFNRLSNNPNTNISLIDRKNAREQFKQNISDAKTIEEIAALVDIAKPYINRHRNQVWDLITKKQHTNTWKLELKFARDRALRILENETQLLSGMNTADLAARKELLSTWRKHSLFSLHRNESKLKGAFGRTSAQAKIDKFLSRKP